MIIKGVFLVRRAHNGLRRGQRFETEVTERMQWFAENGWVTLESGAAEPEATPEPAAVANPRRRRGPGGKQVQDEPSGDGDVRP